MLNGPSLIVMVPLKVLASPLVVAPTRWNRPEPLLVTLPVPVIWV